VGWHARGAQKRRRRKYKQGAGPEYAKMRAQRRCEYARPAVWT